MLDKGLYIAESEQDAQFFNRYYIAISVKETATGITLELVEFGSRYAASQIEDMFSKSKKVTIKKSGSKHGIKIWGNDDFTLYPYRVGVPFYFRKAA
jgi:hypothetical protein